MFCCNTCFIEACSSSEPSTFSQEKSYHKELKTWTELSLGTKINEVGLENMLVKLIWKSTVSIVTLTFDGRLNLRCVFHDDDEFLLKNMKKHDDS